MPTSDTLVGLSDVTRLLAVGDRRAAADLPPLVFDALRKLAAARLAAERPGQLLQPTALVHEVYVRLVGGGQPRDRDGSDRHGPHWSPADGAAG